MEILQSSSRRNASRLPGGSGSGLSRLERGASRRGRIEILNSQRELLEVYAENINFYTEAPTSSITLQEFEKYSAERLKMLRVIERINQTYASDDKSVRYSHKYFSEIKQGIKENELPTYYSMFNWRATENCENKSPDRDELEEKALARRVDHISHFLLRLAFAKTDEQRKWFITLEVDFFRYKMWEVKHQRLASILQKHKFPYEEIDANEKRKFLQKIADSSFSMDSRSCGDDMQVFKLHFTHALDLVRTRRVFLHNGFAYVPFPELAGVIAGKFRSYLSESLSILKKNIHIIEEDERLPPLINDFEKRHFGTTPNSNVKGSGETVVVAQLDSFSIKSFPLCMKHLYDVVQKDHHLKHWGRLQLGLFFRGLGLPLDEATKFWRTNFTKRPECDSGRFDKQYLYNIRHMYGQEGKRADYTPYSCMKVINSTVGPGDHHGCPFRHSDAVPLRVKLVEAGIPQDGIKEIMGLVEQKHFQIACHKYFEYTHDGFSVDGGVTHPNQYFMESRNILTGKKTAKIENDKKVAASRTLYYSQSQKSSQPGQSLSSGVEPMDVLAEGNADDNEMDADDAVFANLDMSDY